MSQPTLNIPDNNLYMLVGDQRRGPFTLEQMREKFNSGEIGRATYLWYPGLLNWITVGDVPEFDRRTDEKPGSAPTESASAGTEEHAMWVYDKGAVVSMPSSEVRQKIRDNQFRRGEMVFEEKENKWYRADQHPELARLFRPAIPPPITVPAPAPALSTPVAAPAQTSPVSMPAPNGSGPSTPVGPPVLPQQTGKKKPKWIFPAIGVACSAVIVIVAVTAIQHMSASDEPTAASNVPAGSRAPASAPGPTSQHLQMFLPIGTTFEQLKAYRDFKRCNLKKDHPNQGLTYRCFPLDGALDAAEFTLRNGRLARSMGWFGGIHKGREFDEWQSAFGLPESQVPIKCEKLTETQRTTYKKYCVTGFKVTVWTDGPVRAQILSANDPTHDIPLELWIENTSKN